MKIVPKTIDDLRPADMKDKQWRKVKNYIRKLAGRKLTVDQVIEKTTAKFNL